MAVSSSQVREFRGQLDQMLRQLGEDEQYADFTAAVEAASTALDDVTDELGAPRAPEGPEISSRVRRREPPPANDGGGEKPPADDMGQDDSGSMPPKRRKGKMPPQFMRGR
jgi:hypothetical protein